VQPTYLSVDLDYFDLDKTPLSGKSLFRRLFKLNVPLVIVDTHEDLVRYVNRSKSTKLINVDYHSDFGNLKKEDLKPYNFNCGTWIDYLKNVVHFEWRYRSCKACFKDKEGRCESNWYGDDSAFWYTGVSYQGHNVRHKQGIKYLPYSSIVAAGVAVSPEYWNNEGVEQDIMNFLAANADKFVYVEPCVVRAWRDAA